MKKAMLILFLIVGASCFVSAQANKDNSERLYLSKDKKKLVAEEEEAELKPLEEWSAFQVAILPGIPADTIQSNVYGLKLGLISSSGYGRVYGVEISPISSATSYVRGWQCAIFANVCEFIDGCQTGLVNVASTTVNGCQIGLVNFSGENGVQVGLVNIMPDAPLPFFPILNIYTESSVKHYRQKEPSPTTTR